MTARVLPMRGVPQGQPCGSGTVPGGVSESCGRTPSRFYPAGWRCEAHRPRPVRAKTRGSEADVPVGRAA